MKVYLIKSPEYDESKFIEVCDFLNKIQGPLQFEGSKFKFPVEEFYFLRYELYPNHPFDIPSPNRKIDLDPARELPLSWMELFSLCKYYRSNFNIPAEDFVVLLTDRMNSLNWLSAFEMDHSRNIFVQTSDWGLITPINPIYNIAYEVVANVLQTLMKLDLLNIPNDFVHKHLRGCMNDLCIKKKDALIKLMTANICADCLQKIKDEGVDSNFLKQVVAIFKRIRDEYDIKIEEAPVKPTAIVINKNYEITLPGLKNKEISLPYLKKAVFIYFLEQSKSRSIRDIRKDNDIESLIAIYKKVRPNLADDKARSSMEGFLRIDCKGFNPVRTKINNEIIAVIGDPQLASYYMISGDNNPDESYKKYSIKIPRNLLDIRY
ncbi:MAG: hypothetical protein RL422_231 [Bacteroidota bacterium]|jgi:hypothetical protein